MKIGLLAYHSAINFGATLQLLSTYHYLLNNGHEPIIINWVAEDLDEYYQQTASPEQLEQHLSLRCNVWKETRLCRTSKDVAHVIEDENIEAVIIGSDAVARHHCFMERLAFPCRTIIGLRGTHSDWQFPNAFWADWQDYLTKPLPVVVISASSQDAQYKYFRGTLRKEMARRVMSYDYLSVRDTWTQLMMQHITKGERMPEVTPDPVFAFSQNASALLPYREETLRKFNLPNDYVVMSFINSTTVSQQWIDDFCASVHKGGIACVMLPFAHSRSFGSADYNIDLPLSPIDWYTLIKYSLGYVGHNMHPIVVALHNSIPFYSFDNYGTKQFNGLRVNENSSKILHILRIAGLDHNRVSCISKHFKAPSTEEVVECLKSFDVMKAELFSQNYLALYNNMMNSVMNALTKK